MSQQYRFTREEFYKKIEASTKVILRDEKKKTFKAFCETFNRNNNCKYVFNKVLNMESDTRTFVSAHPNIIFTHADKGNVTIAMDRDAYMTKMTTLLGDLDTYVPVKKDPTKKLTTSLRSMLTTWKTKGYINDSKYKSLYCSDGSLPRVYGLPKIHKPGCPLRIIVSSIGSPLYSLATYLHNILFKTIPKADSYIKNSLQLDSRIFRVEKLKRLRPTGDHKLISQM